MRRLFLAFGLLFALGACTAEPIWAPQEEVSRYAYGDGGATSLTLITVISNRSGAGGHTGLLIDGSQRVMWDPAGTWWNPRAPERNDLHYGITPRMEQIYIDYHTRETYHTVLQTVEVSPAVAEKAIQLAASYGAVPKTSCAQSTSRILSQLPGFENVGVSYFPLRLRDAFAKMQGVTTRTVYDNDADDNSAKLPGGA